MKKSIDIGDIIIIEKLEYIGNYGGSRCRPEFARIRQAWRVDDINNQGRIKAHDSHGRRCYIHALDRPPCYPYIVKLARGGK